MHRAEEPLEHPREARARVGRPVQRVVLRVVQSSGPAMIVLLVPGRRSDRRHAGRRELMGIKPGDQRRNDVRLRNRWHCLLLSFCCVLSLTTSTIETHAKNVLFQKTVEAPT